MNIIFAFSKYGVITTLNFSFSLEKTDEEKVNISDKTQLLSVLMVFKMYFKN